MRYGEVTPAGVTSVMVVMEKSTVVVVVRGDMDAMSADEVGHDLMRAARCTHLSRCVVIDLREVDFIDSRGLQTLVHTRDELGTQGIVPYLVMRDGSAARRLFSITHLEEEFPIHRRVGDALSAARRGPRGNGNGERLAPA